MGEILDWDTKCSGQTKISKFENTVIINQKILWFQISMQDLGFMAFSCTVQKLIQKGLYEEKYLRIKIYLVYLLLLALQEVVLEYHQATF